MNLQEIRANLKELEQVLALAEEIRYRILISLQEASSPAPRPAIDKPTPPASPTPPKSQQPKRINAHRNHPDLMRTGRGLFAWAKEHGAVDALVAIGKRLDFPDRIIGWDTHQVDKAIAILDGQQEDLAARQEAEPKPRLSDRLTRRSTKAPARVPGEDDENHDQDIPY